MNAKKLLSMLLSAVLAVTTLAGCGEGTNYSNEAVKAANEAQSTVVFETDSDLAKSLQDALEDYTQTSDIKTAMVADENLKDLLTSGYQLDIFAAQGEDAEAAAQAIAQQYIVNIVSGKQSEGKIAMILHKGNGYYYAAVLTYRTGGGSGSGGNGGGSSSGDDGEDNKPVVLEKIEITEAPSNIDYIVGNVFDQTGMEVTAYYSDGSSRKLNNSEYEILSKDLNTAGTKTVTVRYTEGRVTKEDTVEVYVADVKAVKIEVTKLPVTNYTVGDEFDPTGMEVTITYNDDHTEVFTNGENCEFTIEEKPFETVGNQEVTISCEGLETSIPVFVADKEYTVTVKVNGEGGTVSSMDAIVKGDETFTFTAEPKAGYEFDSVKTNGQANTSVDKETNKVTVSNVQSDVTIEVYFKQTVYNVTVQFEGGDGSVEGGNSFTTTGAGTFTIIPETGYKVDKVEVTNGEGNATLNGDKVTLSEVSSDITITVYLEAIKYDVTLNIEGDGTVKLNETSYSKDTTIQVEHGSLKVEATAGQGYEFVSIYDGAVTHKKDFVELFITGNVTITVTFDKIKPVVTNVEIDLKDSKNKNFKTEYWCYENLDLGDLFMEVTYNNESGKPAEYVEVTKEMIQKATVTQDLIEASSHMFNGGNENNDGYWNVTFTFTYAGKSVSFTVRVDCSEYNGGLPCLWMTDDDCSYCKNWKGLDQTASQTAIAKQHNDQ